jgi:7,8-dihydropterin-6-yl-methyl-4-(beta-D-ribofuranosyl)aminobenzene 5'-phosphate synthase
VRIVTLLENSACREDLSCEHGLSLYIETCGKKILFDAGQSGTFACNAEKLGIDLAGVELAVLSHGHYDHGGGLAEFLKINQTAPVYLHRDAFDPHYNGTRKYIGLDPALRESDRLIFVDGKVKLAPGITLHGEGIENLSQAIEPYGLTRKAGEAYLPEDFRHEQYLLVEENGKKICISGCSHRGVVNIARHFRPDVLVGGFHFQKLDPDGAGAEVLTRAAEELLSLDCVYYTGHCTGRAQFDFLKQIMGDRLHRISTGAEIQR